MIGGEVEVLRDRRAGAAAVDRFAARTGFDPRALATPAGQIEPGDADADREGGPAQQMETR